MSIFDIMSQQPSPSLGGTGGIGALGPGNAIYPQSRMDKTQYATPMQLPTSADVISSDYDPKTDAYTGMPSRFAKGGIASIPRFSDGGGPESEGKVFVGDENSGKWVDPSEVNTKTEDPFLGNPDFQNLSYGQMQDTDRLKDLNALKETDQKAYNSQLMGLLNESLKEQYNTNFNYEPTWKQFKSLQESDPAAWHKHQLDWLGHQQGWQIGQNTSERNVAGLPVIQDEIEQAKKAGLSKEDIDSVLNRSSQKANLQNQQRIINEQQAGHGPLGMTTQDYLTVAAILGSGAAAAYFAPAMAGAGTGSGIGLTASQVPNLAAGLGATGGAAAGTGAGWGGLTAASTGGMGLTAASVPSLAGSLALPATGALAAGAGTAGGAGGFTDASLGYTGAAEELGLSGSSSGLTDLSGKAGSATLDSMGLNTAGSGLKNLTTGQKLIALNLATKALGGASGGGGGGGGYTTTQSAPTQSVASNQFQPSMMPAMFAMNQSSTPGSYYQPYIYRYAQGGVADLGGYAAGGKLLRGAGDGMSDDIVANIEGQQPARLADGEFVIPADVVSHLGNGSTDAGAKQLYKMMDRIRQARTGKKSQGKKINPEKFFPKG